MKGNTTTATTGVAQELAAHGDVDADYLVEKLADENGELSNTKPVDSNGFTSYVWEMVWFHAGRDYPMGAPFDLQEWCDSELETTANVAVVLNDDGKVVKSTVSELIETVAERFGIEPDDGERTF